MVSGGPGEGAGVAWGSLGQVRGLLEEAGVLGGGEPLAFFAPASGHQVGQEFGGRFSGVALLDGPEGGQVGAGPMGLVGPIPVGLLGAPLGQEDVLATWACSG